MGFTLIFYVCFVWLEMSTKMSAVTSVGGILVDVEDRSSNPPSSLPSLVGLALRIRAATLSALIELCILGFGNASRASVDFLSLIIQ